ncbi:hypothetical protein M406DRAFT_74357 [Cryphonectria parasitica EP155]|uniref:BTB domain-containing protein n=1 Tax=Cryphonectria parasitica (strain ATCC 38755 / EP155) TaxID=660469 RepID=A0A9P5CJW0_CRYP1|nr:uncharacterized protein M406DRAFT_74357 [Cryphonectria parasitica EP155]KAF3761403.1 hypothetical protein M406DRAFT_74357 [Cryphonectria parasitica EP155]
MAQTMVNITIQLEHRLRILRDSAQAADPTKSPAELAYELHMNGTPIPHDAEVIMGSQGARLECHGIVLACQCDNVDAQFGFPQGGVPSILHLPNIDSADYQKAVNTLVFLLYLEENDRPTAAQINADIEIQGFNPPLFWIGFTLGLEALCPKDRTLERLPLHGYQDLVDTKMRIMFQAVTPIGNRGPMEWLAQDLQIDLVGEGICAAVRSLEQHMGQLVHLANQGPQLMVELARFCLAVQVRAQDWSPADKTKFRNDLGFLWDPARHPTFLNAYLNLNFACRAVRMDTIIVVRKNSHDETCACPCVRRCDKISRNSLVRRGPGNPQPYVLVNPFDGGAKLVCQHCDQNCGRMPWRII